MVQSFSRSALLGSVVVKDTRVLVVKVAKIDFEDLKLTFRFCELPRVVSCHWYGSRANNRKLGKLYMGFKSTKCCLHFTSAFD